MLRPSLLPPALVVVATLAATLAATSGILLGAPGTAQARPALDTGETFSTAPLRARAPAPRVSHTAPLSVMIDTLTPSYIPRKGPIRITGSVTNTDTVTWTTVNLYPFVSATPMTSAADLADAVQTDPNQPVGDRITSPGPFHTLDRIEPGESLQYSIKLSRAAIEATEPGVYWFGVHALGEGPDGRVDGADGRARTFLPLVPQNIDRAVDTALVIPLRRTISFDAQGALQDVDGWTRTLIRTGRLRSLVDFGASAGSRPITWLIDPALPDAVRRLVAGNPQRSLAPTESGGPVDPDDPASGSPQVTAEPEPSAESSDDAVQSQPLDSTTAEAGSAWLARLHEALKSSQILALPYGDLDVAAAAVYAPTLYSRARARSGNVLEPWALRMTPAVGSPSGFLNQGGILSTKPNTTVLVTDRMFGDDPPALAAASGHKLVVTSSGAAAGGPGPDAPRSAVNLRQRILSEAALHALSPEPSPLVVVLPNTWIPDSTNGFFEGLDVDWLNLTTVEDASRGQGTRVGLDQLDYPGRQTSFELDAANFTAVDALIRSGEVLDNILTNNDRVASTVIDQALASASYSSRVRPDTVRAEADRSRMAIDAVMRSIVIEAPSGVTLSSASGRFAATVINGLDEAVTVGIEAISDDALTITPPDLVDIGPGGRTTVLLRARTSRQGVHNVTLIVTDSEGTPLGSSDELPIRSAQVSNVIWLILGTGGALLFGAIFVRLLRRITRARSAAAARPKADATP